MTWEGVTMEPVGIEILTVKWLTKIMISTQNIQNLMITILQQTGDKFLWYCILTVEFKLTKSSKCYYGLIKNNSNLKLI